MTTAEFAGGSPGWMPRGACRGEDPELFFPITSAGAALAQILAAKAVCFRCAPRACRTPSPRGRPASGAGPPGRNASPCGGPPASRPTTTARDRAPRVQRHAIARIPADREPALTASAAIDRGSRAGCQSSTSHHQTPTRQDPPGKDHKVAAERLCTKSRKAYSKSKAPDPGKCAPRNSAVASAGPGFSFSYAARPSDVLLKHGRVRVALS